jgi:hypothetical protein
MEERVDVFGGTAVVSDAVGTVSSLDIHYLASSPAGVENLTEHHELGLFTDGEYRATFEAAGLDATRDDGGLLGRGLYFGVRPPSTAQDPAEGEPS